MKTSARKKLVLLLTAGFFALTSMTPDDVNLSGEWKLNESKSKTGPFPLCIFAGDRMRSKTLKITTHTGFITLDVASSSRNGELVTRQEKLIFDGKQNEVTYVGTQRTKSSAKWSDDGQTMTVHSIRSFDTNGKTADVKVTEVWKLINGGKSISIEVKSSSSSGENSMTLVYDKQLAVDYRF